VQDAGRRNDTNSMYQMNLLSFLVSFELNQFLVYLCYTSRHRPLIQLRYALCNQRHTDSERQFYTEWSLYILHTAWMLGVTVSHHV